MSRRRRRRRGGGSPFSFSFLDVFACTLGALIFILVACALQGQGVTRALAEELGREIETLAADLEPLLDRVDQAEQEAQARAFERDALERSVKRRRERIAALEEQVAAEVARKDAADAQSAALAYTWGKLPTAVGSMVPVYLECRDGRVRVQPEGPTEDAEKVVARDSQVGRLLLGLRGDRRRYAVLILRPGGGQLYRRMQEILEQLGLDYGRDALPGDLRIDGWRAQ